MSCKCFAEKCELSVKRNKSFLMKNRLFSSEDQFQDFFEFEVEVFLIVCENLRLCFEYGLMHPSFTQIEHLFESSCSWVNFSK